MADRSREGALDGLLIVALEQAVAAPYCTGRLADAGARVIKIEREEGDFARDYDDVVHGESAYFVWLNRGKESLTLNIKDPEDASLLARLIDQADVFIQNLAPGAAARAGFDSKALRARNPRLITCDISGYGNAEPYADMKAYDLLVQAETGLASITGRAEGPGRVGVSVCDIACGMYAYMGILEAVIAREKTGVGRGIETSLFAGMADWMSVPLLHFDYGGEGPERVGLNHPSIAPYGAYDTKDGPNVLISVQNEREWHALCADVLGDEVIATDDRFADNLARVLNRPALNDIINGAFTAMDRGELISRLRSARIAFGEINEVSGLSAHPSLERIAADSPTGPVNLVAPPVSVVGKAHAYGKVPAIGEHSDAIRKEFAE